MDVTPQQLSDWLAAAITCTHLQVEGDGRHFQALIVSDLFEGLSQVKRHQAVYKALGARMHSDIHALSIRAMTLGEYAAAQ